jgi:ankyrin repeat protein
MKQAPFVKGEPPTAEEQAAFAEAMKSAKRVNECDVDLLVAAQTGDAARLEAALADGADPKMSPTGDETALMAAAHRGREAIARRLAPLSELEARDRWGRAALMIAAEGGDAGCVAALLEAGADPKATDKSGATALMLCTSAAATRRLLPVSDPLAATHDGFDALMMAAMGGRVDCLKELLPFSNPLAQNEAGRNALMWAAYHGQAACVALLVGVSDLAATNARGLNALEVANADGDWDESCQIIAAEMARQEAVELARAASAREAGELARSAGEGASAAMHAPTEKTPPRL